jgi:hypothetical protein
MATQPRPVPECNVNGVVIDKCTSRFLDGTCRRCGKRKR